uniref:NmrA-like domain-containing protein n=1 Tax=Kalanchoe fedtschenkoi TaxID=63787 RepID=A0A7N1A6Q6_KALFE
MEASGASKILIVGGTGYIGRHVVRASINQGHPTFVYGRPITPQTTPSKLLLHQEFLAKGVTFFQGELDEVAKLVEAVSRADIVISTLAFPQILDQLKIIEAMKVAGNVKRFIPSEFGMEEGRLATHEPFHSYLERKISVRRATEASGIPYTFVAGNCFARYFLHVLFHTYDNQADTIVYGTGETKAVMNLEEDIGMYAVKAADDPRTVNRIVIVRPPKNITSQLELISLWERLTGENLRKIYLSQQEMHKLIQSRPHPDNIRFAILNSVFIDGDTANYELNGDDLEASKLYPDADYSSIDKVVEEFLADPQPFEVAAF